MFIKHIKKASMTPKFFIFLQLNLFNMQLKILLNILYTQWFAEGNITLELRIG